MGKTEIASEKYLYEIQQYFSDENSSEHSYRTTFENYLKEIFPASEGYFTQQDQRVINGNKPDFVIIKNKVPMLYIEVKKVGEDLDKIEKSNQADRYFGYDNLIISDYVDFRFFRNGQRYGESIALGKSDKKTRTIVSQKSISVLSKTITDFVHSHKEPIKRGKHLAQIMGGKAQRIRDNVRDMLESNAENSSDLLKMQDVVREHLITNLDNESFADMYAQTLVYGLFAARYNDESPDDFSRIEARELVPKTNPFLRSFFDHIAGNTFPDRLRFIVDELCEAFSHADVHKLLTDFYATEKDSKDPIIHFYEDFLREYDAKKKMDMGVFYTPRPVVQFIVRAVDSILKTEFGLVKGLADTTKIAVDEKIIDPKTNKEKNVPKEYHRVQVLDIATGTGTFLNEVINHIHRDFAGQQGRWSSYVKNDLLPRIHGFELMMASYTIAHLKLGMTLHDSGVTDLTQRLGVYLTNTLDTPVDYSNQNTLFGIMDSIADEAKTASRVKSQYPIMCVIGNPPYSGISQNKNYTDNNVYKIEPGGLEKLNERKHWLDDDYVKFIRYAESMIEKNGEGVMGMITAHGYIDNPTFRGMRWHLRKTFDKIFIIDLHGNSRKKEVSIDGNIDENIFDIMTGVSVILGVKKPDTKNKRPAKIYKGDLWGTRKDKFINLDKSGIDFINWTELSENVDIWILEGKGKQEYHKGFPTSELFKVFGLPMMTGRDTLTVSKTREEALKKLKDILSLSEDDLRNKYNTGKDTSNWSLKNAIREVKQTSDPENNVIKFSYRLFDDYFTFYTGRSSGFHSRPQNRVNGNFLKENNIGLLVPKQLATTGFHHVFLTNKVADFCVTTNKTKEANYLFPLYLYTENNEKISNLNKEIWDKINEIAGKTTPENILDYIYAVLHSPTYREKYKEFLKIDFPRVPYPENKEKFFALIKLGEKLRGLHLMTDPSVNDFITTFPNAGSDEVEKITYKKGSVYINTEQYFGNVPEIGWNFYIGGYQPAQKYLKDRKGRKLSNEEIEQYQKIIKVLVETEKIMQEIDDI